MTIIENVKATFLRTKKNDSQNSVDQELLEEDLSTFSKILAIYTRNSENGELYCIEEKPTCHTRANWGEFRAKYKENATGYSPQTAQVKEYIMDDRELAKKLTGKPDLLKVSEYVKAGEMQVRGLVSIIDQNENEFHDWFLCHILDQCRLELDSVPVLPSPIAYHEMIANFFASNLKNTTAHDEWEACGRDYFIEKVRYFTDRFVQVECVLPAFPCKSSNGNKVHGAVPDKGEELALRNIYRFTELVKEIYPPGMKVWIVSDGHVFSDCIGVDDDVVDRFTENLHELFANSGTQNVGTVGFYSLIDIFFKGEFSPNFDERWVEDVEVLHYNDTKINEKSDLSRRMLMKGCDTDDGTLRKQIGIPRHPRLHLYRGFTKFMMEDLSQLPKFQNCSRKQFKKTVSKVAFNMIKRNDAYSNLVELMFPRHLRISIHAHTNSGPKFGIKVISEDQCRIIKDLQDLMEPKFDDLLHIPTPWHNCVVEVIDTVVGCEPRGRLYLTKTEVVKKAISSGKYTGEWNPTKIDEGRGGHYILRRL
ncbi:Dit1p KNAG_0C04520 [Huiozyma naganishii CBS 8797]|uniref:TauD/TfdA-like domain-containing protein n=1 Tax=Huiozyma naganishii (strain ATCC MYA-139 / BCRC 22969 / CBS 8797 / KCTC 17520 / NBRC 10181 / NCYC 3082 / Yp74L-3) TaxID=1071383 RepID=J7S4Y8_HUIN7|nr:hypothetical protein KNAG_0C04520 [Kazachstania naganishii CBS 8797]CCK69554.1 hypothetical protein KNAG_0C04520 [Kazachstania naganishii CBS 8797]